MSSELPGLDELFDRRLDYPDAGARKRFERLVGIDEAKERLAKLLGCLVNPVGPREWSAKFHPEARAVVEYLERRPPLAILAGDVGTGKTELAETVGDAVARRERINVTLFPLSLATRGSGKVGEITRLLAAAFDATYAFAKRLKRTGAKASGGVILFVDEADALTQRRDVGAMHHEDRAGVNAFIRGVDRLAEQYLPVAVILATNRLTAIDPAVRRRAAEVFLFDRPNDSQRRAVLSPLHDLGFSTEEIDALVRSTGPVEAERGFTYSDITQRFLPGLVLDAYPERPITFERAMQLAQAMKPTPAFEQER